MDKIAVVAVAYNRLESLNRLLNSLNMAVYPTENISLIISIDNSGDDTIINYAETFIWKHGRKAVITYGERLGLREHILKCGTFMEEYDALVILEDDLIVSPYFWDYVCQTVEKYQNNLDIAGISLYAPEWTNLNFPFIPQSGQFDVYYMRLAQSWGQIWMKKSWHEFTEWYESHKQEKDWSMVPKQIRIWPESSWLKYHIKYCIVKNKYFIYPYVGLTTCFCDEGMHYKNKTSIMQIPISLNQKKIYTLPENKSEGGTIIYDEYFERMGIGKYLRIEEADICMDIYGDKFRKFDKQYLLSTQVLDYKIIKKFGLQMRPQEANVTFNIAGNNIFLYDKSIVQKNLYGMFNEEIKYEYYHRLKGKSFMLLKLIGYRILKRIRKRIANG